MFSTSVPKILIAVSLALTTFAASLSTALPASAQVERNDDSKPIKDVPGYCWQDSSQQPRAVAIAVHGLTMHGGVFDTMARRLASEGTIVYAQDMRGFGRWITDKDFSSKVKDPYLVDYEQSYSDLIALIKSTKERYPDLPLFCIGESLGADMVLRAASDVPGLIDGIVLSAPAIKHRSFIVPLISHTGPFLRKPNRCIDLIPWIMKLASDDPHVAEGAVDDPLVRKHLSAFELLRSSVTVKPALEYARKIPATMPVLVIQGSADKMVQSHAVMDLLCHLKSNDQTVKWFTNRGHLLLETSYIRPDTLETVDNWLYMHVKKTELVQAETQTARMQLDNGQSGMPTEFAQD